MAKRIELQALLETILGSRQVYFQPPESIKLSYPCVIYELDTIDSVYADNAKYKKQRRYSVTLIDRNPDSIFIDSILDLPYCSFNKHFKSDNLNHYTFTLYY